MMKELSCEEKLSIEGGAINWGLMSILGGLASFIIGVIDGYINPNACK